MSYRVNIKGHGELFLESNTTLLDLIGDRDPERKIIAARVNNRTRELTYELRGVSEVEFLTVSDPEAMK